MRDIRARRNRDIIAGMRTSLSALLASNRVLLADGATGTNYFLAVDADARIIGGCCGTTPEHLAAMRAAIDSHVRGDQPTINTIVEQIGPLTNAAPAENVPKPTRRSRR